MVIILAFLAVGWSALGTLQADGATSVALGLVPLCIDIYEPDNSAAEASLIMANGASQVHTLHVTGDEDWIAFDAVQGAVYTATTFDLALDTDTVLRLYDVDGATLLAINDDYPGSPEPLASQIVWTAPAAGPYYLMVRDYYSRGDCLGYSIRLAEQTSSQRARSFLPAIRRAVPPTPTATPTATDTPTPKPSPTPTPTPTVTPTPTTGPTPPPVLTIPIPGMDTPNALAVNSVTNRVYITSRDNNKLIVLDGNTQAPVAEVSVGARPFGVAVNLATNRVYVAGFDDGRLSVIDGATNQAVCNLLLGARLSYVGVNAQTNRIYVTSHGLPGVFVVDGATNTVARVVTGAFVAPFGVAVGETLDRVYVGDRDLQQIVTLDGEGNVLASQTIQLQPAGVAPYAMAFNPRTSRLYVMLAAGGSVNRVQIFQATQGGLLLLTTVQVGEGGPNGGGGVAVNTATNRVYVTNSVSNTVSVIDGLTNQLRATIPVGIDPFGVAANPITGLIFAANRTGNTLSSFYDGP
jgi:YVTN family beta-propeller protein